MHKKIDLFYNGQYLASTNMSKTCKEAKLRILQVYQDQITYANSGYTDKHYSRMRDIIANPTKLKAYFDKDRS